MKKRGVILIVVILVILLTTLSTFSLTSKQIPFSLTGAEERSSPSDWISEEQIKVYEDYVQLDIKNPSWASFTNTNSMDPFIDETSHAIEIMPDAPEKIHVGDVISYKTLHGTIIHRVIETGVDKQGYYYVVKGDNNAFKDPLKVRFSDIEGVVVAVIY